MDITKFTPEKIAALQAVIADNPNKEKAQIKIKAMFRQALVKHMLNCSKITRVNEFNDATDELFEFIYMYKALISVSK